MRGNQTKPKAAFRLIALFAGTLLTSIAGHAQQYGFQYFGVEQGLTNLAVKTLFQDRTGFIWVGTENGVFRYEGIRFREFLPEHGLPLDVSASIGEASDGSVLVGNRSGLFRLSGERFLQQQLPAGRRVNGYSGIFLYNGVTYLATDAGLLTSRSTPAGQLAFEQGPRGPGEENTEAHSVFVDAGGVLWGCGNSLCESRAGRVFTAGLAAGLEPFPVLAVTRDREGNVWIEQNRRLLVRRAQAARFEIADPKLPPTGHDRLQHDSEGRLLVPTTTGLAIRENGAFRLLGRAEGLLPPVYSVLQDREGSVWLGLAGRGLARWLGYRSWESFSAQSGLTGETVYEILPLENGEVWAGTEAGLFRGQRTQGVWRWRQSSALGSIPVHAVQKAPGGRLWLGTDARGAALFDPKSGAVRWFGPADGLANLSIYSILVDTDKTVWAGSEKGVYVLPAGASRFHRVDGLPAIRCWAFLQTSSGQIWAATADGVWLRGTDRWTQYSKEAGLINRAVISIAADKAGALWIGYRLSGTVTRLELKNGSPQIQHFKTDPARDIKITYFLGFDSRDRLWAGTNIGVQMLNGSRWDRYDRRDGLIWDDCDLHGFAAEPDGHIWIGTSGGLSRFLPRDVPLHREPPRSVFTSVMLGQREIDANHPADFEYTSNPLLARFTALRFGRDRDIAFRYRIDPVSTAWTETPGRELQFPALPPGEYRLEVEARDATSGWSNVPAVFAFRIRAPWWRTWWFLGSVTAGAMLMAALLLKRRSNREEAIRRALERAVAERTSQLSHQYRHDVLTGLPNRLLFRERLNDELLTAKESEGGVAVLFIDLDRFKRINDTWGHQTGDLFLQQIAERLRSGLHRNETIARIGGDEFIVLIPGIHGKAEAEERGWDLLRALDAPIQVEGKSVFATMSVGIAAWPEDAASAATLMAAADAAMYRAKGAGKNQVQLFERGMAEAASRPQNIEDRLREALRTGGFRLVYQPQYTIDGELDGFEALLRLKSAEAVAKEQLVELGPAEFIPIAEESGLILEMGEWVLREACRQADAWHKAGFENLRMAVNVSVMQLAHSRFEQTLLSIIEQTGLNPEKLELELTETALLKDTGDSANLLNRLRRRGVRVALDDFGTGFSPMQYLHQLPVDVVKIDQVFVRELDSTPSSMPLVEGMVKLAKTLSLRVVAEGCETAAQFEVLRQIGFDVAQGNLLSPPLSAAEAEIVMREARKPAQDALAIQ